MKFREQEEFFELLGSVVHAQSGLRKLLAWPPMRLLSKFMPDYVRSGIHCFEGSLERAQEILMQWDTDDCGPLEHGECRHEKKWLM
ncbi:MAG TPA: hypothetical protein VFE46_01770 [Pirellulales bacterium]|jgi:hypothetical protein|nr:hypothetical protein [Pirellulales bacterium]